MREPRVALLFRIFAVAWCSRNFKGDGEANLSMGVRFDPRDPARSLPVLGRGLAAGAGADLGFLRRIKAQRREMERRTSGEGAPVLNRALDVRGLGEI